MPSIDDPEDQQTRAMAVAEMLCFIGEGIMEGKWKNFAFNVRQHRRETFRHGRRISTEPAKVEITFSMDVNEDEFRADVEKRKKEVKRALEEAHNTVDVLLIEHEGSKQ